MKKIFAEGPKQGEMGYQNSIIYGPGDFEHYNPDALIYNKGTFIYDKMLTDDQVKAVVEFKKHAVLSRDYYFDIESGEDGEPLEEQEEMADFFKLMIKKIRGSWTDKLLGILSAIHNGYSITEKIYEPISWDGKTMWGLKDLKLRPFDTFNGGFIIDNHGNILGLQQQIGGQIIEIPVDKVIHFVHQPDKDPQYGRSDLRAAYRAWWSKDIAIKFQNIHLERHAGGFVWASYKGSLTNDNKSKLQNILKNITARMGAYLPENIQLNEFKPLTTDAYEKAIAQQDKAISKSILVPNLIGITEQGSTGSYAQAQSQVEAFFWVLDAIAKRLEETLNEQLFRELALWNFGTEDFPLFRFEPVSDAQKEIIVKTWAELVSKGAVTKTDSDEDHIRRMMGFPEKVEEEEEEEIPPQLEIPEDQGEPEEPEDMEEPDEEPDVEEQVNFAEGKPYDIPAGAWTKRVDFVRTDKILNARQTDMVDGLNAVMGKVKISILDQVAKIAGQRSFGNIKPTELETIVIPKNLISSVRKISRTNLEEAVDDGFTMAGQELPKKVFAKIIRPGMDKTQAERFLASRAMQIAGILDVDVLKAVQNVLFNAISYDKTLADTIQALKTDANLATMLPETDAAGRPVNVPARLENIARTNVSDALNKGRMAMFKRPEFEGYIKAYQYSATLDGRTTEICSSLHGKIRKEWGNWAPPNHYQCRSILIPITVLDDWDGKEDNLPASVEPQEGFK